MEAEMDMTRSTRGTRVSALRIVLALFFSGVIGGALAQQRVVEVIELKYRSAEQIVPVLKPLLAPGGTISALQNRVIVSTTPQNLAQLRKVLDAVDTMPKRLVISVREDSGGTGLASEAEVSGSIGADGARVSVPGGPGSQGATAQARQGENVARARVFSSNSAALDRGVQTLQILEGNEALIRIGQSVPLTGGNVILSPLGVELSASAEYRDVDTGYRVRPRVNGDRVTLEISLRRDSLADHYSETFNVQRIDTVVSGRLGEWMDIGGVGQGRVQTDGSTIARRSGGVSEDRKVFVKVDLVP
jgi:hypothetical protein